MHGVERTIDPQDIIVNPRLWLRGIIGARSVQGFHEDVVAEGDQAAAPPNGQNSGIGKIDSRLSSVSVRTAPPQKPPEPVGRKFDWSKAPKTQDVLAQIESEIRKEGGSA